MLAGVMNKQHNLTKFAQFANASRDCCGKDDKPNNIIRRGMPAGRRSSSSIRVMNSVCTDARLAVWRMGVAQIGQQLPATMRPASVVVRAWPAFVPARYASNRVRLPNRKIQSER